MAHDVTAVMGACRVFLLFTVFPAGVREGHRRVAWLVVAATEAFVSRHLVFGVGVVAVWAGPVVKSK